MTQSHPALSRPKISFSPFSSSTSLATFQVLCAIFVFFSWKTILCGFSKLLPSRFSRLLCGWSVLRGTIHCVGRLIVFAHCQLIRNEQQLFLCILFHWKVEHQYGISKNTSGLNSLTAVALEDLIKPYYKVSLVITMNMNNIEIIIVIIRVNQALL